MGREVVAVPGNITSPLSAGSNRLIRDGAAPVLEPADLLHHFPEFVTSCLPIDRDFKLAKKRVAGLAKQEGISEGKYDLAAAEELKSKAKAAEKAYTAALEQARADAAKIIAATKAEIQKDLDVAMAAADVQISAKSAESEKRIAEALATQPLKIIEQTSTVGATKAAQRSSKAFDPDSLLKKAFFKNALFEMVAVRL